MSNPLLKLRCLVLFLCLGLYACPTPDAPSLEDLLVIRREVVSVSVNGQEVNPAGFSIRFNNGGSFNFNTPGIDELPQSGSWNLNSAGNIITLNGNLELRIRTMDVNNMVFEHSYPNHKAGNVLVLFVLE